MFYSKIKNRIPFLLFLFVFGANVIAAQTTEFTYQGKINDTMGTAASYDFEFRLFDVAAGGTAIGTNQRLGVPVSSGVFTVRLDFGANFNGQPRWLEIAVKPLGSPNAFTILTPRQPMSSAPYAVRSLNAATAETSTNSLQLGGAAANQFVQTGDARLSDARNPLPNSGNYIQNTTTQQAASNFNITGSGTAGTLSGGTVNAGQYNIGGNRILSTSNFSSTLIAGVGAGASNGAFGSYNSFFGGNAGQSNVLGANNSFFGSYAGQANTAGNNSFFGAFAGDANTTGTRNAFFGDASGGGNQTGSDNSFFGSGAGKVNTSNTNSFFGSGAGSATTTGGGNSFFGYNAGDANTTGIANVFLGSFAGNINTAGGLNVFLGFSAGNTNTTGDNNTIIGGLADTASNNLQYATAIGAGAVVSENNTLVLGRSADKVKMSVLQITGGSDLAENFEIADAKIRPGMVVAIDPQNAGKLILARGAYNRRVAGIVSGANNLAAGMLLPDLANAGETSLPVALSGRVWVYADATKNPILPGDLLTTSPMPGCAMKVVNYRRAQGAIIGKAMTELKAGQGLVLVLVSLQ